MTQNPHLVLAVGDPLLTREALEKKLSSLSQSKEKSEISVKRIFAKDADWNLIFEEARTYPFLCERQVFWMKQAELIDEEGAEALDRYFEKPAPFSYFFFETESFAGKKKFMEWVAGREGEIFNFEPTKGGYSRDRNKGSQVRTFIREKLKALKMELTPGALRSLEESSGEHFFVLSNTLEKLSLKSGPGGTVTEKDVEVLVDEMNDSTGWDLAEALASKKISKVFEIYFNLYEEDPYASAELLGLLGWQIRRIYEAKRLARNGVSKQELATRLKMSPYFVDRFLDNVRAFDETKLKEAFQLMFETDEAVKTGKVSVGISVEMLLLKLGLS